MSSFRSYTSPWSKSSYSSPSSSSSYLRGTGGGSTSLLSSSSASNKDDKPYGSTGSYSRSRYGSSAIEKSSGDAGDGGGSGSGTSRDGGTTSSASSGYRSSALTSSSPSKSTTSTRTSSYRSPYSTSTLGSSSSTSGVGGGGAKDRSSSRDRLGYLSSISSPRGRVTSPEPEDSSTKNTSSSLSSSYSSRPSTLRPISISRATSLRSRYKDDTDYTTPTSPSTAPAGLLRSPRPDITPFKWTGRYTSSSGGLRSPGNEISPTVFGVSTPQSKGEEGKAEDGEATAGDKDGQKEDEKEDKKEEKKSEKPEMISVVTRGTSPNPPTSYLRIRRYELAWQIQKEVPKPPKRESVDAEVQTDKVEEENTHSSRYSRLSSPSSRLSTSSWYSDRYSSGSSSYVPRTYSRYGSTPSPSVSKRPSPVRSSSGSLANSTNDSGAPDNEKDSSSSSKTSSASASKPDEMRSRDTKTSTSDKAPSSKEDTKIEPLKTESKSSEELKTPLKKCIEKTNEEPKTESKSSDYSKSSKLTEDSKTPSWKKSLLKTNEEPKTDNKSSEVSKSKYSEDSKTMPSLKSISKSTEDSKSSSSKSENISSDEPKIPAWKAALKQSLESKASSTPNSSQKTSEDSKPSRSKAETKSPEDIKTPSKPPSKSSEDSKASSEASRSSPPKSISKSSEEPKAPPGKRSTKTSEESKPDSKTNKTLPSKSEAKSIEETGTSESKSSVASKTPSWKAALKTTDNSKKTKNTSSVSETSNSTSSKISEDKSDENATENVTSAFKDTLRSEESIYPITTEKDKETTSAPSITTKPLPSSACSSTSSSPSRGRERSPSGGRGTSRPPSVPTSAPSSRGGSSERADTTSSSSRTSAGVKSLSSYSSTQDLSAPQKRLTSPRPPPSPRPIQRSSSAANLQGVANKDFRKSTLNMSEEPVKSEPIESHKRVIKKKTTRSKTLGGSELLPRESLSRAHLVLPLKPPIPPVGGKLVMPVVAVVSDDDDDDDDETSVESADEDEEGEEEVLEHKVIGGGTAAKPPIPKKEGPAEDGKSKPPKLRRRGETGGSWREAYKVEDDGGKEGIKNKKVSSQSEVSGDDSSGAEKNRLKINKIRRQPSGELPWWMDGSKEVPPEGVIIRVDSCKNLANEKLIGELNKDSDSGTEKKTLKLFHITRDPSGELPWWLDESQPVPEGVVVKAPSCKNIADMSSGDASKKSSSESSRDKKKPFKLMKDPSGELPWWADGSKEDPPEGVIIRVDSCNDLVTEALAEDSNKDSDSGSGKKTLKLFKLARDPSGELPWWLDASQSVPEGVVVKVPSCNNIAGMSSGDASKRSSSESSRDKKKPSKLIKQSSGESIPEEKKRKESSSSLASKGSSEDINKKSGSSSTSEKGKPIKPFKNPSGERAWWMDGSEEPMPDGIIMIETTPSASTTSKSSEDQNKKPEKRKIMKISRQPTGEIAWWMEGSSEPIPDGIVRIESSHSLASKPESSEEGSKSSGIRTGKLIPIWRQASGERAWWMDGNDADIPEGIERVESNHSMAGSQGDASKSSRADSQEEGSGKSAGMRRRRLWRVESGERAWWMEGSDSNVPEGVQKEESTHSLASVGAEVAKKAVEAKKGAVGASSSSESESESESSESEEEEEDDMPMEGSSEEEEGEGGKKKGRERMAVNGNIPRAALGVRTSPDGVEEVVGPEAVEETTAGGGEDEEEDEDEEETMMRQKERARRNLRYFIGRHTNIDDLLGGEVAAPGDSVAAMVAAVEASQRSDGRGVKIKKYDGVGSEDESSSPVEEVDPSQVRIHDSTAQTPTLLQQQTITDSTGSEPAAGRPPPPPPPMPPGPKLDDAALQVYRDGDYGAYLDLEASISEQPEEFEGFQSNRKNSIVLRTQLSVRVHAVIEKLLNSEGRELRRALFSLKQIFQEDKDLVHEFVQNEGLACLIKVGSEADQNYQNYILRALGQVMLYVDGMNGVMAHNQTVQWLYSLIASRFRLVVKTALKLLLVFAEYVESNCLLLIRAVLTVDKAQGLPPWSNIMRLLKDYDTADTELLIYAMTLINRTLNGIPDQDTYYDQVDALEEQGMESVVQRYMSKQGTDLDLLRQFQIYEAVLHHEDGEEKGAPLKQLDETIRKTLRNRKSLADSDSSERRKSRRHSTGTSPMSQSLARQRHCNGHANLRLKPSYPGHQEEGEAEEESSSGSSHSPSPPATGTPTSPLNNNHMQFNSGTPNKGVSENVGVTPALRRRRERAERQRSFIREQQESGATLRASLGQTDDSKTERVENGNIATNGHHDSSTPWSQRLHKEPNSNLESSGAEEGEGGERAAVRRIRRENTVRDLTQKLASQGGLLASPTEERVPRDIGDMSGIVSKAKEGLARSKSKADLRSPTDSSSSGRGGTQAEIKKSETELHWEELLNNSKRPLNLCDLDFTDLIEDDDVDVLSPALPIHGGLMPPPPPPCVQTPVPPPAPRVPPAPPPVGGGFGRPPPPPPLGYARPGFNTPTPTPPSPATLKKSKKTVKLFWKEVREDPVVLSKLSGGVRNTSSASMIWDEIQPVSIDTQKLEHLFESRAKDLIGKKQQELNKSKEIIVLDPKRSNAINIGMTKLPPPRSIKTAILKMDSTIVNREGIEKLLTMLPTEEERSRIQEAQSSNPDVPLGSAEQFLLTLASISELSARLKLWAFKLDYENSEKEVAEPLMDLKQGMETLRASKTFRSILSTLLSVGIFLNGNEVKGFQIEYLAKVPEVKDTVHKHSLLHHLCHIVMEKFPDSSDLYSEIGAVTRASKVDFDELTTSIQRMEQECKASWDHLKVIAKHDGSTMVKVKMSDFLADCAERIIVLGIVHRRVMNRFSKFLLWLGIPIHRVQDTKPNEFCKIISEFALEYRTTRERVLQQLEKKASHRERNKTRGKMITDVGKFRTKEDRADAELRQLLGSDFSEVDSFHGSLPWRRQRKDAGNARARGLTAILRGGDGNECLGDNMTDGDDEILESLVKTATKGPSTRTTPRERKRTRHADRKSLKRSRTRENNVCQFLAEAYNQ